jgi:hypothetical protein
MKPCPTATVTVTFADSSRPRAAVSVSPNRVPRVARYHRAGRTRSSGGFEPGNSMTSITRLGCWADTRARSRRSFP